MTTTEYILNLVTGTVPAEEFKRRQSARVARRMESRTRAARGTGRTVKRIGRVAK